MKKYYIDKRVNTNGKVSTINLSNTINLYKYITNVITAEGIGASPWTNDGAGRVYNTTDLIGIGIAVPNKALDILGDFTSKYIDGDAVNYRLQNGTIQSGGLLVIPPGPGILNELYRNSNYGMYTLMVNQDSTDYGGAGTFIPLYETKLKRLSDSIYFTLDGDAHSAILKAIDGISGVESALSLKYTDAYLQLISPNYSSSVKVEPTVITISYDDYTTFDFGRLTMNQSNASLTVNNTATFNIVSSLDMTAGSAQLYTTDIVTGVASSVNLLALQGSLHYTDGILSQNLVVSSGSAALSVFDGATIDAYVKVLADIGDTFPGITINPVREFVDNAAAILAGLVTGAIYRTGDTLKIVH